MPETEPLRDPGERGSDARLGGVVGEGGDVVALVDGRWSASLFRLGGRKALYTGARKVSDPPNAVELRLAYLDRPVAGGQGLKRLGFSELKALCGKASMAYAGGPG